MIGWYLLKYRKDIIVNLNICTQEEYFSKVKEKFITVALYSQISLKPPMKGRERTIQDFPPGLPGTMGGVFHHPGTLRNS